MRQSESASLGCRLLAQIVVRKSFQADIDAIIARGEERTTELNSRYEGLNFEDLSNFKSEASVQQWEGEDFRSGVCMALLPSDDF